MLPSSIARQATALARRTLIVAFSGVAVLAALTFVAIFAFGAAQRDAADRRIQTREAAADLLAIDERLSMFAYMAAATGEAAWVARYEQTNPLMSRAVARAAQLAPPALATQFRAEAEAPNRALKAIEDEAFAAVRAGELDRARMLLDQPAYAEHKQALSAATSRFAAAVAARVRDREAAVTRMTISLGPLIALMLGAAVWALWRRLNASLDRSEAAISQTETQIRDLAMNDGLTGIPNRRAMREHLVGALARADRSRTKLALLMIDLDRFKPVNDEHGHLVGDLVLKEVSRRLSAVLRQGEFRARFGGDEFAAVIELATEDGVRCVADRLIESLSRPMVFDEIKVSIGASIGAAIYPSVASSGEELMRKADAALYRVKQDGRGAARLYDVSMDVEIEEQQALENDLRESVKAGELTPAFQPIINLETGAITGFEILARWRHPTRGEIPPAHFVPMVEAAGLINEMTFSVLERACEAARVLPGDMELSLNISPAQLQDQWLVERLLQVLTRTSFSPRRLQIEVSEQALVADLAAAKRVITSLKNIGMRVALDDFGSGYSSLCYLSELPFDVIKIDSTFVRTLHERAESAKIVAAIVSLAKSLGVRSVAESVENAAQAAYLKSVGCDGAQGYFFHRPLPAAQAAMALAMNGVVVEPAASQINRAENDRQENNVTARGAA